MASVEDFFSAAGWTLVILGLIACFVPHCFKRGVIAMLLGDLCLFFGIVMPRTFMDLAFFSGIPGLGSTGYKVLGGAISAVVYVLFTGPFLIKRTRSRRNLKKEDSAANSDRNNETASVIENDNQKTGEEHSDNKSPVVDPAIFSKVREAKAQDEHGLNDQGTTGLKQVRKELFSGLEHGDRPL
ncbi:MAG: hypothetical protein PUA61_04245 [Succinatimonas hippei]|nr:hypothetical protein [Succinatimonas hippei]